MKKSQIAIFFIMGLILILSMILYVVYLSTTKDNVSLDASITPTSDQNSVKIYVDSCVKNLLDTAVIRIGENGGFIQREPEFKIQYTEDQTFTFLYTGRADFLPDVEEVERDIGQYIGENLVYCVDGFSTFQQRDWDITAGKINSSISIFDSGVAVNLKWILQFKRDSTAFSLNDFSAGSNVPLGRILDKARNIVEYSGYLQDEIDRGNIQETYEMQDLDALAYQYPDSGIFLWIIKEKDYKFLFATELET